MDFGHEKVTMNVEDQDRLSSLPDDLIHMILSFIRLKQAIRTCVLSSRCRSIWKSMPYLNFSNDITLFHMFLISNRNTKMQLSSVNLGHCKAVTNESVERILDYTFSHNIQQLTIITGSYERSFYIRYALSSFKATPTSCLPALTALHLYYMRLSDDNISTGLLSKCPNLKNLSLGGDTITGTNVLNICHPRLSNLTLEHICGWMLATFNVVVPQLKYLTIRNGFERLLMISAPELTFLVMKDYRPMQLSTKGFPSLEKVDLCFSYLRLAHANKLVCLLQQLHNVKFLTLNLKILEILSSSMEPISHQPSPFANLKILKLLTSYPITNLQDGFPSAIITMISREEIRAMRNITTTYSRITDATREV
ncbi:unnamed protein product [Lactuca saligna]|uniref:F-box domain-containing protein n=1 Tax=Lactuca saligna TaxID=75948 RepID=A0AA35YJ50_LACSI|nr:unnamed protein product [Lactuca saligna]